MSSREREAHSAAQWRKRRGRRQWINCTPSHKVSDTPPALFFRFENTVCSPGPCFYDETIQSAPPPTVVVCSIVPVFQKFNAQKLQFFVHLLSVPPPCPGIIHDNLKMNVPNRHFFRNPAAPMVLLPPETRRFFAEVREQNLRLGHESQTQ